MKLIDILNEAITPSKKMRQSILDTLKDVGQRVYDEMKKEKLPANYLQHMVFTHLKAELPKFGRITDKELKQMLDDDRLKSVEDEADYLMKIFSKK